MTWVHMEIQVNLHTAAGKTKLRVKSCLINNQNKFFLSWVTIIDVSSGTKGKWLEKVLQNSARKFIFGMLKGARKDSLSM